MIWLISDLADMDVGRIDYYLFGWCWLLAALLLLLPIIWEEVISGWALFIDPGLQNTEYRVLCYIVMLLLSYSLSPNLFAFPYL